MNFCCDQCKQKYHVADEKVHGRSAVRFKCSKCGFLIRIEMARTSGVPASHSASEGPSAGGGVAPSIHPQRGSSSPGRLGTAGPAATVGTAVSLQRSPGVLGSPGGVRAAAVTSSSVATASARARQAPGSFSSGSAGVAVAPLLAPSVRPSGGSGDSHVALKAQHPGAAKKAPASGVSNGPSGLRVVLPARPESRASLTVAKKTDCIEVEWYVGVRDVPVGPLNSAELSAELGAGEVTPDTLVWRDGFDDWQPLRNVQELSALVRQAVREEAPDDSSAQTVRRDVKSLIAIAPPVPAPGAIKSVSVAPAPVSIPPRPVSQPAVPVSTQSVRASSLPVPVPASSAPVQEPSLPVPVPASSAPVQEPLLPVPVPASEKVTEPTNSFAAVAKSVAAGVASQSSGKSTLSSSWARVRTDSPGLSVGAWVMMAGVGLAGVAVGLWLKVPHASPDSASTVGHPGRVDRGSLPRPSQATAPVALPSSEQAPVAVASASVATVHSDLSKSRQSGESSESHHSTNHSAHSSPALGLNPAAARAAMPLHTTPTADPGRAEHVLAVLNRSRVLADCWNSALRRNAVHPRETLTVRLDVVGTGRANVSVSGTSDPALAQCIRQRASAMTYDAGAPVVVDQRITLTPGG